MNLNRLLVLAAGLSLVPATVGVALAFSPALAPATSGSVGVIAPTFDVDVNLYDHVGEIPADGAFHRVDDITVIAHDATYSYTLTTLEVILNGSQMPPSPPAPLQCGAWHLRDRRQHRQPGDRDRVHLPRQSPQPRHRPRPAPQGCVRRDAARLQRLWRSRAGHLRGHRLAQWDRRTGRTWKRSIKPRHPLGGDCSVGPAVSSCPLQSVP